MRSKEIYFIYLMGLLFINNSIYGQSLLDFRMNLEKAEVSKFKIPISNNTVVLKNHFGNYKVLNPDEIKAIKGQAVFSVEVIYSDYPKGENFELLINI